jgi:hypothetical protein
MVHNKVHKDNCTSSVVLFVQDYGPYAVRLRTKFHTVQISPSSVIYNPDPLRRIWLARDLQQKSMWCKLWPRSYCHFVQNLAPRRDSCLNIGQVHVEAWCVPAATAYHVYIEIIIKFAASYSYEVPCQGCCSYFITCEEQSLQFYISCYSL